MVYTDAVRDRRAWVVEVGLAVALILASGGFLLGRLSDGTRASSVLVAAPGGAGKAPVAPPAASPAPSSPAATGRGLPPALAGGGGGRPGSTRWVSRWATRAAARAR